MVTIWRKNLNIWLSPTAPFFAGRENLYRGAHLWSSLYPYTKFHWIRFSRFGDLPRTGDPISLVEKRKILDFWLSPTAPFFAGRENLYRGAHLWSSLYPYTKFHWIRFSRFGDLPRTGDPLPSVDGRTDGQTDGQTDMDRPEYNSPPFGPSPTGD